MTPQEEFTKMMEYSGLIRWHNAGYKGQGIRVFNCESLGTTHGAGTGTILKRCAPDAEFYCGDMQIFTKGDLLISAETHGIDFAEYIKANQIDIITSSFQGTQNKGWTEYCEKLQSDTGVIIFNSAGNDGAGDGETLTYRFPNSLLVGALSWSDGNPKRIYYSSVGEELDFMAFSGLIGGTSASAPFLAGMTACIFSKYGKMSPAKTKDYLKSISKDLGSVGDDIYYGEGMPILGEAEKITQINIKVDGKILKVNRVLINDENYIRLRDFEDVLGICDVEYDSINGIPVVKD